MYKKCKVITTATKDLPTNGLQPVARRFKPDDIGELFLPKTGAEARRLQATGHQVFHLHILSEDEIGDQDFFMKINKNHVPTIHAVTKNAFLNKEYLNSKETNDCFKIIASTDSSLNLPSPSPEFLQIYCQDQPTEVLVDYKLGSYKRGLIWLPQINKDNQISIKKAKQNYTEEEVETLLIKAFRDGHIWGVSYSTWFVPTKKQHKEELQKCLDSLM
jgi:hypothetical protein